jgi:hypothetical protein
LSGEFTHDKDEMQKMWLLRKYLADMNPMEMVSFSMIRKEPRNEEFLLSEPIETYTKAYPFFDYDHFPFGRQTKKIPIFFYKLPVRTALVIQ